MCIRDRDEVGRPEGSSTKSHKPRQRGPPKAEHVKNLISHLIGILSRKSRRLDRKSAGDRKKRVCILLSQRKRHSILSF